MEAAMKQQEIPISFVRRAAPIDAIAVKSAAASNTVWGANRIRVLPDGGSVAISPSGDYFFFSEAEAIALGKEKSGLSTQRTAELQSRFFLTSATAGRGTARLLKSRQEAKRATVSNGASLHIIVPTLQCAHSCQYCQVSRSLDDHGHTISVEDLDAACEAVFLSPSPTLTVEFQGGDPLLRFDLLQRAIVRISERNKREGRAIRYVVASTLHQLTPEMCIFFGGHQVCLSTSIDGPAALHNKNRPTKGRDSYERTIAGVDLARQLIGHHSVSALMTTTRASLPHADLIVDEYVRLGLPEVFIRPLSSYGFAKRNQSTMAYDLGTFMEFYSRAFERVLWWNAQGVQIREVYASIIFNKILSTFDAGYVDLQSPTGAGTSVVAYNCDGYIYPSDEARMLAETGDVSLRMGTIEDAKNVLLKSPLLGQLRDASAPGAIAGCDSCAYHRFCGPNPVDALAQHGSMFAPVHTTEHCQRHMALFDFMFTRLKNASEAEKDLFYRWSNPANPAEVTCDS